MKLHLQWIKEPSTRPINEAPCTITCEPDLLPVVPSTFALEYNYD